MSAETMKMPEPIIDPTTSMVASRRLRLRLNSPCDAAGAARSGASGGAVGGIRLRWVGSGSDREGDVVEDGDGAVGGDLARGVELPVARGALELLVVAPVAGRRQHLHR